MEKLYKLVDGESIELDEKEYSEYYECEIIHNNNVLSLAKDGAINIQKKKLEDTDFYIIRHLDPTSNKEIPKEVLDLRTECRLNIKKINSLEDITEIENIK